MNPSESTARKAGELLADMLDGQVRAVQQQKQRGQMEDPSFYSAQVTLSSGPVEAELDLVYTMTFELRQKR